MISDDIREELVDGLIRIFVDNVYKIVLYGSVARGEAVDESDVDVAVILYSDMAQTEEDTFIHWNAQLDLKYNKVFSIVDINKNNMEKWGDTLPFYKNILNEGITLWTAA